MAKVVIDSKINDLTTSWENYTGQRVEELIKEYLTNHDQNKFGYVILPRTVESDNFYHIKCFASEESYQEWDSLDEEEKINSELCLADLAIPIVENNGITYSARLRCSQTASDRIVVTEKNYSVTVLYQGIQADSLGKTNVGISATVSIERSTDSGNSWEKVGETTLNSVDPDIASSGDTEEDRLAIEDKGTSINIGQYFSDSNPQQIRLRASYVVKDDGGILVASVQSAFLVFSNITYTKLTLKYAGNFESPINATSITEFPLSYILTGEVERTFHYKISGSSGTCEGTQSLRADHYTNSQSIFSLSVNANEVNSKGLFSHGIHTIEAWLTCSVGEEVITSDHVINQVLVINPNTPGADLTKTWVLLGDISQNVTNYVAVQEFLRYSVWKSKSSEEPLSPWEEKVPVTFVLTDYGTDGISWDTEYLRSEQEVTPGSKYILPATVEIENSEDDSLDCYLHVLDGEGEDFLYESCGLNNFLIKVDNTEKFSPTSGVHFFLNPKNRNNSEANPFKIINAAKGETISATFQGFSAINDLWVISSDDKQKVLRINAGQKLTIDYDWLAPFKSAAYSDVTLELDVKIKNVTDEETPIITLLEEVGSGFIGLKMFPMYGLLYSKTKTTNEAQDFRWQEGERTHITINLVSSVYSSTDTQTTLPLCRVYINGVLNREFLFGSWNNTAGEYEVSRDEWYKNGSKIVIGQDSADLDIYSIRCYQKALSSADILKDYISTLPTSEEKIKVRNDNAILGGNGLVSSDLLRAQGKNVLIWHGVQPYFYNSNTGTGWWEIHRYDSDGKEMLECSGTICKETKTLKPTRQGTTANTYYYSNIQTKLKDVEEKIFVALDRIHSDFDYSGLTVETRNGIRGVEVVDGWIDGNGLYRGPYYQIDPTCPLGQKLVLKINYASCMQSHLMGGCRMYNDLYKMLVEPNSIIKSNPKARVAKYQDVFHYFTQEEGSSTAVYQGPGTFGPGKMDDLTWGYNKDNHPMFCMIEGASNNLPLTDFRVPWIPSQISVEEDDGEVAGYVYNENISIDLDKFKAVSREVNVAVKDGNGNVTYQNKTLKAPSLALEEEIKKMVNFLYLHNTRIRQYVGTYDSFLASSTIETNTFYWCTEGSDAYCLKRYDFVGKSWIDAGWNADTNTVVRRKLSEEFPTAASLNQGQWELMNKAFINAIAADAKKDFCFYFKPDSALFHYAFVNQFMAGTDNCSKNTYYVLDPTPREVTNSEGETRLVYQWELHADDVDTIFATDNSGFQSKPYYIDRQNPYPEDSEETCYEGGANVLFNLIEAMYENSGEIRGMMYNIFTKMCSLVENSDGYTNTPWGALQKYFFSTQRYLSATAYNEAARIRYEYPSTPVGTNNLPFVSGRGVAPITQSMGDQLQSELQYMKRRLVLFASYAEWGDFSTANAGNLGINEEETVFGIEACKDIEGQSVDFKLSLTPHQYIYPTGFVDATTMTLRKRCIPGETYTFKVNGSPIEGDTAVGLFGIDYYRSIGNIGDQSVRRDRDFTISGKRLVEFIAVPTNNPDFRPPTFAINAPLVEEISLYGCSWIKGELNLTNCTRLRKLDLRGTSFTSIKFPETSSLTEVYLPGTLTSLVTVNLPNLEVLDISEGVGDLENVSLAGIPKINTYQIISQVKLQNAPLISLYLSNIDWESSTPDIVDYLYGVSDCTVTGQIHLSTIRDMTYERKLRYLSKWGNIDDTDNPLYIEYPIDSRVQNNINKIFSIVVSGPRQAYDEGRTYQYKMVPYLDTGQKAVYGNNFSEIIWTYSGYQGGASDDSHNWIESHTGIFHANIIGDSVSTNFDGEIKCTLTRTDGSYIESTFTVHLYYRDAEVGDYLYADGTYLPPSEYDSSKTVVGICFYVNPEKKSERLAVATNSLSKRYCWGLYSNEESPENMCGVELSPDAGLSNDEIYDLPNLPNVSGKGTIDGENGSDYINEDTYLDGSTLDGFKNYKEMFEDCYHTDRVRSNGKAASMIGFTVLNAAIRDNQVNPSRWAEKNQAGIWEIPAETRVPWGYIQTLHIINHRNTILSNVITETGDNGEIISFGLTIPAPDENITEWTNLDNILSEYADSNEKQIYFPAASACYAYEPESQMPLKDGEEVDLRLGLHQWFLPSIGDLARVYWYHRLGYDTTEGAIYGPAVGDGVFTRFNEGHTEESDIISHWSSTELHQFNAWDVHFSDGLTHGIGKSNNHNVRPIIAF